MKGSALSTSAKVDICLRCAIGEVIPHGGCRTCRDGYLVRLGDRGDVAVDWPLWHEIKEHLREMRHGDRTLWVINTCLQEAGVLCYLPQAPDPFGYDRQRLHGYEVRDGVNRLNPSGVLGALYFTDYYNAVSFADSIPKGVGQRLMLLGVVEVL